MNGSQKKVAIITGVTGQVISCFTKNNFEIKQFIVFFKYTVKFFCKFINKLIEVFQ